MSTACLTLGSSKLDRRSLGSVFLGFQRPGCRENRQEKKILLLFVATVLDFLGRLAETKFSPSIRSQIHKYYTYSCLLSVCCAEARDSPTLSRIFFSNRKPSSHRTCFLHVRRLFADIKAYQKNSLLGAETQRQHCFPKTRYLVPCQVPCLFQVPCLPSRELSLLLRHAPRCH